MVPDRTPVPDSQAASRAPCPGAGHPAFHLRAGELWCEDVPVRELVQQFGTPLYVYSGAAIDERIAAVRSAFGPQAQICYAVKANSNLTVLRRMHERGIGFDVVSGGELERLQAAGVPTAGTVFAGVGKEEWEIEAAVAAGILFFNVESEHELPLLAAVGRRAGVQVPLALRLNPDVDAGTHAYISTGKQDNKFGIALERAGAVVAAIARDPNLSLCGYHVHLGSQLHQVAPYVAALQKVQAFVDAEPERSQGVTHYDLGGGFGIGYGKGDALSVGSVAAAVLPLLAERGWRPVVEPGRYLVGDAGALVTTVLGDKRQGRSRFLLVDAAMNDLLRPALYGAEHPIVPVAQRTGEPALVDIVGPVCETGDFLGRQRSLPPCERGDLLAVLGAGAYGATMGSNYNTRRRPAEVLVDGSKPRLVRRRETFAQLFANEVFP